MRRHYADPTQAGVPYEGGFIIAPIDTRDVLYSLSVDCHEDFFEHLVDAFHNDYWVRAAQGHWLTDQESQILLNSWSGFVEAVKHDTRFHFAAAPINPLAGPLDLSPGQVLAAIGSVVDGLQLVRTIAPPTDLFRVRVFPRHNPWIPNATTMAAPPSPLARAGRMNPAGISYFYAAFSAATAIGEVVSSPPESVALARFSPTRDLTVIDFCDLPPLPSIFDASKVTEYEWIVFLSGFVEEISRPIRKDGREHVEYVPTQVLCEWFAQIFVPAGLTAPVDGLIYPSAVVRGGRNIVLFPTERGYNREFESVAYVDATKIELADWSTLSATIAGGP